MEQIIATLNQNQDGATFALQGQQVIGSWQQDEAARGALSGSSIDLGYQITVTLNPDNTFTYKEKLSQQNTQGGLDVSKGGLSFEKSSDTFSGKSFGTKKMGYTHHFGGDSASNKYSYNFEADKIKKPLLAALEGAGYQQKKSFFGKLFGK